MRAALSTAAIVMLAGLLDRPALMSAALSAWLTCLADAGGPIRRRVPVLIAFALLGAVITAGFGLLRGLPLPVVVPIASLGIFALSFARVWGASAMQVGNLLSVAAVLALRTKLDAAGALDAAGLFAAGSLWAALLTLVIWRIYPHRPARRAVGACYVALAAMAADLRRQLAGADRAAWDRHMRDHRRTVREAIEAARVAVLETVRARGSVPGRAHESWIRLEVADQIFGALIGLSDLLEDGGANRDAADLVLRRLRPVLVLLARAVATDVPALSARLTQAVAEMETAAGPALRPAVSRLAERLRIAITLDAAELPGPAPEPPGSLRARITQPVRANLDPGSAVLRHAARVAVASAAAFAITLYWPGPYEHWLTITLLLTMQPFFALTITRAFERVGGTVLGGFLAAAITVVATTPLLLALLLFPLTLVALTLRRVNFGLFVAAITPIVVLLSELAQPERGELALAWARALNTLGGGALAIACSLLLWPSWEPGRLLRELRAAVAAHGLYAQAELSAVLGEAADVDRARRAAGLASNNVEASLQRALLEPRSDARVLEAALTVDAALRRMAGRLSALDLDPGRGHDPAVWQAWRTWLAEAADRLGAGDADLPPRPEPPAHDRQADTLTRLARQMDVVAGALARLPNR